MQCSTYTVETLLEKITLGSAQRWEHHGLRSVYVVKTVFFCPKVKTKDMHDAFKVVKFYLYQPCFWKANINSLVERLSWT